MVGLVCFFAPHMDKRSLTDPSETNVSFFAAGFLAIPATVDEGAAAASARTALVDPGFHRSVTLFGLEGMVVLRSTITVMVLEIALVL